MKTRKKSYGTENVIGAHVERIRKEKGIKQKDFVARTQISGLDINPTGYSKLEGQVHGALDREVYVIAKLLGIRMEDLFDERDFDVFDPLGASVSESTMPPVANP